MYDDDDDRLKLDDRIQAGELEGELVEDAIEEFPDYMSELVREGEIYLTPNAMEYLRLCLESD